MVEGLEPLLQLSWLTGAPLLPTGGAGSGTGESRPAEPLLSGTVKARPCCSCEDELMRSLGPVCGMEARRP